MFIHCHRHDRHCCSHSCQIQSSELRDTELNEDMEELETEVQSLKSLQSPDASMPPSLNTFALFVCPDCPYAAEPCASCAFCSIHLLPAMHVPLARTLTEWHQCPLPQSDAFLWSPSPHLAGKTNYAQAWPPCSTPLSAATHPTMVHNLSFRGLLIWPCSFSSGPNCSSTLAINQRGSLPGMYYKGGRGGLHGGRGRGVWLGPPSSQGPPMVPAEGAKTF